MATIKQKFTGDASQLAKEYNKILQLQIKQEQQLRAIKSSSASTAQSARQLGGTFQSASRKAVASLTNTVAAYAGVREIIMRVNDELRKRVDLEKEAAVTSRTVAAGEAAVAINIGDVPEEVFQEFTGKVGQLAKDINFPKLEELMFAASTTLSATEADQDLTLDILKTAGRLSKHQPSELPSLSESTGDVARLGGFSADEAAGLILSTMEKSRLTSLSDFKNVGQAIAAGINSQPNTDPKVAARETAALFATFTSASSDRDGAISKTAVATLTTTLGEAFELDQAKFDKLLEQGVGYEDARKQSELSLSQRIDEAQKVGERVNSAIMSGKTPDEEDVKLLDGLVSTGLRAPQKSVATGFLRSGDNAFAEYFDRANASINPDAAMVARRIDLIETGTVNLRLAERTFETDTAIQSAQLNTQRKSMGTAWDIYEKALEDTAGEVMMGQMDSFLMRTVTSMFGDSNKIPHMDVMLQQRRDAIIWGRDIDELEPREQAAVNTLNTAIGNIRHVDPMKLGRALPAVLKNVFENTGSAFEDDDWDRKELTRAGGPFDPSWLDNNNWWPGEAYNPKEAVAWLQKRERMILAGAQGLIGDRDPEVWQLRKPYPFLSDDVFRKPTQLNETEQKELNLVRETLKNIYDMQKRNENTGSAAVQARMQDERD